MTTDWKSDYERLKAGLKARQEGPVKKLLRKVFRKKLEVDIAKTYEELREKMETAEVNHMRAIGEERLAAAAADPKFRDTLAKAQAKKKNGAGPMLRGPKDLNELVDMKQAQAAKQNGQSLKDFLSLKGRRR